MQLHYQQEVGLDGGHISAWPFAIASTGTACWRMVVAMAKTVLISVRIVRGCDDFAYPPVRTNYHGRAGLPGPPNARIANERTFRPALRLVRHSVSDGGRLGCRAGACRPAMLLGTSDRDRLAGKRQPYIDCQLSQPCRFFKQAKEGGPSLPQT